MSESRLPADRVGELEEMCERYAEALLEIASAFDAVLVSLPASCRWCGAQVSRPCDDWCPGLLARRALGVA